MNQTTINPVEELRAGENPSLLEKLKQVIRRRITSASDGEGQHVWIRAKRKYPYPYSQRSVLTITELERRRHNETLLLSKGFWRCGDTDLFEGRILVRFQGRLKKSEGARRSLVLRLYPPVGQNPPVIYLPGRYQARYKCH
ncbi:MAG: hypothetical protein ACE5JA_11070, partial [bacterium]